MELFRKEVAGVTVCYVSYGSVRNMCTNAYERDGKLLSHP
jgi:hypothetical protein